MCAQFLIKAKFIELKNRFGIKDEDEFEWAEHILPYRPAPVLLKDQQGQTHIKPMSFSLVPHWSKEPKVKFATHNARIETVAEKPTWRKSFLEKRCLVPMTGFIEPIYEGDFAGFMVDFHRQDQKTLYAAGIWDEWTNKETGEVLESFAILTGAPSPFVASTGHDREPLFLHDTQLENWIDPMPQKKELLLKLIEGGLEKPTYAVEKFRALKNTKKPKD